MKSQVPRGVQVMVSSVWYAVGYQGWLSGSQAQESDWLETQGKSTCDGKGTHGE